MSFLETSPKYEGCMPPTLACVKNKCRNGRCLFDKDVAMVREYTNFNDEEAISALLANEGCIANAILSEKFFPDVLPVKSRFTDN